MKNARWVRVTTLGDIPPREGRSVLIGEHEIAIFNLGDRLLATSNRCPHKGGPLCDGILSGPTVVCPLHGWKVNLEQGSVERPAAERERCIETYPVRIDEGVVVVQVPTAAAEEQVA